MTSGDKRKQCNEHNNRLCHNQKCEWKSPKETNSNAYMQRTADSDNKNRAQWDLCANNDALHQYSCYDFRLPFMCFTFVAVRATKYVLVVHASARLNTNRLCGQTDRILIEYLLYVVIASNFFWFHFDCTKMETRIKIYKYMRYALFVIEMRRKKFWIVVFSFNGQRHQQSPC